MVPYIISKRENFLADYSLHKKYKYDFSVSGKTFIRYPFSPHFCNILNKLDCYVNRNEECKLLDFLASKYHINKDNLILGPGANGILQNIIKILFNKPGLNMVTPFYTFHQASYGVNSMSCDVRCVKMGSDFSINFQNIKKSVDENTKMVFLCNPNNPTGLIVRPEEIIDLAKSVNTFVVVSEASIEFSYSKSLLSYKLPNNLIVIRSFSKDFGLAGIRLGFAYMSSKFKNHYLEQTPTNQVGNVSILIANYACKNYKTINKNIMRVSREVEYFQKQLSALNIPYLKSRSNSIMICKGINKKILEILEEQEFKVVTITGEKGEMFVRIAVQKRKINKKFIKLIKQLREKYNENFFSN